LSDEIGVATTASAPSAPRRGMRSLLSDMLFGTRFVTIWLAIGLLLIVCRIVAPSALSSTSLSAVLPFGSVIAVVALGQMLVIMMGGIDLSMAASISLLANVMVGAANDQNGRIAYGVVVVMVCAIAIGLVNGLLIAVLELNPLIVTLSTSLVLRGITTQYRVGIANNSGVPKALSRVVFEKVLGISYTAWFAFVLMLVVGLLLRSTAAGRRFQAVGANRRAAWMAGFHVRLHVVVAYIGASIAAGIAGIILGGLLASPGVSVGANYLFGPVSAVVLGGAALSGGLASPASTWAAAIFVKLLLQLLAVRGLSVGSQPIVYGAVIVLGMLISGDRIADVIGRLLVRSSLQDSANDSARASPAPPISTHQTQVAE